MTRSLRTFLIPLAPALLLACRGESRPAQAPENQPGSFESSAQPAPAPQAPAEIPAQPSPMPAQPGEAPMSGQQPPSPSTGAPPSAPMGTPPAEAAPRMSEKELCDALKAGATMKVEEVEGGVAIVIRAKNAGDLSTVREHARAMDRGLSMSATPSGETCVLFDAMRAGATERMSEEGNSVRITFMAADPTQVRALRQEIRGYAGAAKPKGKSEPQKKPAQPSEPAKP
jgi:hypothetical protein